MKLKAVDVLFLLFAALTLGLVFLFQKFNYLHFIATHLSVEEYFHANTYFIFNKTLRLLLNDVACMAIIYVLFKEAKYLRMSFYVLLIELLVILPLYLIFKLSLEGPTEISSPFLSQIHRLIVNPMLMILLMIGFVYQRSKSKR